MPIRHNQAFRWGILGPGDIARRFAAGLSYCSPPAKLEAVGSRSIERASQFAAEFGAERCYGSYEELAADHNLDAIYIATPHTEHASNALLCLQHGHSVLVEKPFTINAAEAEEVARTARERRLFCMEAMWTRFFPAMTLLRDLVSSGAIDRPRMVMADFGFRATYDPEHRLFNPALGGGGLLDVGIYPLSFACMLLGQPVEVAAQASLAPSGVDDIATFLLRHGGDALSILSCATQVRTTNHATVLGEVGSINVQPEWWKPDALTLAINGKETERVHLPYPGTGFQFEADEVQTCIRAGKLESAVMPLDETVMLMRTLDMIRQQIGVTYPGDAGRV